MGCRCTAKLRSFMAGSSDTVGINSEPPTQQTWRELGRALNLTPQQKKYLIQLREMFLHSMSGLIRRRQELSELLQVRIRPALNKKLVERRCSALVLLSLLVVFTVFLRLPFFYKGASLLAAFT